MLMIARGELNTLILYVLKTLKNYLFINFNKHFALNIAYHCVVINLSPILFHKSILITLIAENVFSTVVVVATSKINTNSIR